MPTRLLNTPKANVRVYADAEELALKAARSFARLADQYVIGGGRFTVALSGGSTPKAMLSLLARDPFRDTVPWESIYFFWGDERTVPPDHADSNYRMAADALLAHVPVPSDHIFRIPADDPDPERAAADYEAAIRRAFGVSEGWPRFDLVMLGMGPDGHTASLFPGTTALHVLDRIVVSNFVPKFDTYRITLTAPAINAARNVMFVAGGADKAATLKDVLEGPYQPDTYPSQMIRPGDGALLWMVDEAAAAQLGSASP
jgi:6-phosphogluconolactonase